MNHTLKVSLFFAVAMAAFSQTNGKVSVKIPFEFTVGATTLPAGEYEFSEGQNGVLYISSAQQRKAAIVLTNAEPSMFTTTAPSVRFEKEEGVYSLSEVNLANFMGRRVIKLGRTGESAPMVSKMGLTNGASKGLKK